MRRLLFLILIIPFAFTSFAQEDELTGRKAPNFKLEDLKGKVVDLQQYLGEGPVLLSFWATWCKPCHEELVHLQKLYNEYKDKGFTMLAISTDSEKSVAKVKPFVKSKRYNFPVLLDTNSKVARMFYARNVPYTVMLDEKGNIVYTHSGYMKGDELKIRELVEEMIN